MLAGKEFAGSAGAGLHLVNYQQHIVFPADFFNLPYITRVKRLHSALTLHTLQHHRADIPAKLRFQSFQIAGFHKHKAFGKREEILVEHFLPGRGQGGNRPAVEGIH